MKKLAICDNSFACNVCQLTLFAGFLYCILHIVQDLSDAWNTFFYEVGICMS